MDPLLDARLTSIEQKLDETTKMLSSMRRAQKTASVMRWLYWLLIIGIGIASLYLIQPYIEQLGSAYGVTGDSTGEGSKSSLNDLLEMAKELKAQQ